MKRNIDAHILPGEDPEEFKALMKDTYERLRPVGPMEEMMAFSIVDRQWRLKRAARLEFAKIPGLAGYEKAGNSSLKRCLRILKTSQAIRRRNERSDEKPPERRRARKSGF